MTIIRSTGAYHHHILWAMRIFAYPYNSNFKPKYSHSLRLDNNCVCVKSYQNDVSAFFIFVWKVSY